MTLKSKLEKSKGVVRALGAPRPIEAEKTSSRPVLVFVGGVAFALMLYSALLLDERSFTFLINEDHPIEDVGAGALLVASVLFFLACSRKRKTRTGERHAKLARVFLLATGLLFLFGSGEEISWGQRILGFDPPEVIRTASSQKEANIHNLNAFNDGFGTHAFQLLWFGFGILLPVACAASGLVRRTIGSVVPVMPLVVSAVLVVDQILAWTTMVLLDDRYYNASGPPAYSLGASIGEIKETLASVMFAVGAFYIFKGSGSGSAQSPALAVRGQVSRTEADGVLRAHRGAR